MNQIKEYNLFESCKLYYNSQYIEYLRRYGWLKIIKEAKGAVIIDTNDKSYIDFVAGYGVFNIGHNHPQLIEKLINELESNAGWNRPFVNEPHIHFICELVSLTGSQLDKIFLCSTGAEAVDTALKFTRLITGKRHIITATGAFHGYTIGALSLSGIPRQISSFKPLLTEITHVPYGEIDSLRNEITEKTAAVILEPVQAEIGAIDPPRGYLKKVNELCNEKGVLFIIDEVRTGVGRTGPFFAVQEEGFYPDILLAGKSLGGGIVPVGVLLTKSKHWKRFEYSFAMSASSFAGNRLTAVAGLKVLEIMKEEYILRDALVMGNKLRHELEIILKKFPSIFVRLTGRGMLLGLHCRNKLITDKIVHSCVDKGLLLAPAFCNPACILIEPPLIISEKQIEKGIEIICNVCSHINKNS
jgi:putrescine aminotransferase